MTENGDSAKDGCPPSEGEGGEASGARPSQIRDVVDAVTGLVKAVPIYEDALQPAAKETGKVLVTVVKAVQLALAPVSAMVWGYEQVQTFLNTKLAARLADTPPENIVPPKLNVAGPLVEALRFSGSQAELSEMFANLLAASMDKNSAAGALPAFVEIIKQLTSDEAKLLRLFRAPNAFPLVNVRWVFKPGHPEGRTGGDEALTHHSHFGQLAGVEFPHLVATYIGNLSRLGLIEVPEDFTYTAPGVYEPIETDPTVQHLKAQLERNPLWRVDIVRKGVRMTALGRQFTAVCLSEAK